MNISTLCLSIILVADLFSQALPAPLGSDMALCCFSYISRKLPQSHVQEYFYTSSKCSQPAVVFVTRKKREICANPDSRWVKEYVNSLELQ
ncbi:C-C motif chemokine 5-like [Molothrus aeneus]|nr:C-C motif chemokine 5-like [Molothrus ater]XP_054502850.1 C-C motif chemokine 5-like [Agelaius phoeniceus]NXQ74177.1 CCL5 protein [Quiscalus mexicanus]